MYRAMKKCLTGFIEERSSLYYERLASNLKTSNLSSLWKMECTG
jgi:hypothetical protein